MGSVPDVHSLNIWFWKYGRNRIKQRRSQLQREDRRKRDGKENVVCGHSPRIRYGKIFGQNDFIFMNNK